MKNGGVETESAHRLHALLMELIRLAGLLQAEQAVPGMPVSLSQAFTVHELDRPTPPSQRELAERLRLEKSTVSRLAADLERKGLLVRERDPGNRRLYRLRLTEQGRALHARMAADFHQQYERWVATMTDVEQAALIIGLEALVRAMRADQLSPPDDVHDHRDHGAVAATRRQHTQHTP